MDLQYIQHFLQVVQLGSMSEAARQLDLSPAAIAQQMRTLERSLGAPLLVRQGRSVRPTAAGERLFERGQQLVQDCAALQEWVASDEERGQLRLGAIHTALHGFLPDVLQAFVARHPQVKVQVRVAPTPGLYTALLQGELDVAVCLHPGFELPKAVCWAPLRHEPLVVLCQPQDAARPALELLRTRPLVRYDRQLAGGKLAERCLQALGLQPRESLELNSVLAVALMVERGLGVGLVPDIGDALVQGRQLCKLPVPLPAGGAPDRLAPRELGVLWLRSSPRLRWADSLRQCAQAQISPAA